MWKTPRKKRDCGSTGISPIKTLKSHKHPARNSVRGFSFSDSAVSGRLSKNELEIAMQNPSIWEKLRAFIHEKSKPEKKPQMRIPDSVWIYLTLVGTALLAGVSWTMLTDQFGWQQKLPAITISASLGLFLFSAAIHHWIQTEKEEKLKRSQAEQQIIEDREEARLEKAEAKAEKLAIKRRKARGLLRNLWEDVFGTKE
jgi:hypothetical protein